MKKFRFKSRKSIDGPHGVKNGTRAIWAEQALSEFRRICGYPPGDTHEDPIKDLIGDLLHLADREGLDGEELLRYGHGAWQDER